MVLVRFTGIPGTVTVQIGEFLASCRIDFAYNDRLIETEKISIVCQGFAFLFELVIVVELIKVQAYSRPVVQ